MAKRSFFFPPPGSGFLGIWESGRGVGGAPPPFSPARVSGFLGIWESGRGWGWHPPSPCPCFWVSGNLGIWAGVGVGPSLALLPLFLVFWESGRG